MPKAKHSVVVCAYSAQWPAQFASERDLLLAGLTDLQPAIHHIGSTSVCGLAAKPVIDILIELSDVSALDTCGAVFAALGYEARGEYGIAGRRYFTKGAPLRTHQVHAFQTGSYDAQRHLAFRDYLRSHADAATDYGALKMTLAQQFPNDIQRYMDGKDALVKALEIKALAAAAHSQT